MNNEQEKTEQLQEARPVATPPPFCHNDEPTGAQEPEPCPTHTDRIAALGLEKDAADRLEQLTQGIDSEALTPELLTTLAQGVTHDNDVQNADASGYLRGRNEKIEAVLHPQEPEDDETTPQPTPAFPRYCRRSIWSR